MDFTLNIILGIALIIIGVFLISFYQNLKREKKEGGLSFKIQTAGIGCIIIGVGLIFKQIF